MRRLQQQRPGHLARWRAESGNIGTALTELDDILADQVNTLGPHDIATLTTRHNIAHWRARSGDVTTAPDELRQLLPDQTRILGYNNPVTKTTRGYIAYLQYQLR